MRGLAPLLLAMSACSPSGESNEAANAPDRQLAATVTIVSTGGADCAIRWNGARVSQEALTRAGLRINLEAVERLDAELRSYPPGEAHEYDGYLGPYVRVEAQRGLPYSCFGPALGALQRGAFSLVTLRPAGEQAPEQRAWFAVGSPGSTRRYAAIVRLAAGGRMTWNGEAVDLNGLRQRVRALGGQTLDDVVVAPAAEADFMAVYEAIRVVGEEKAGGANMMPILSGCAGTTGPVREPPVC